ncbi:MAG TPA: hypothetical protein VM029_11420, partial [Opitutaceae bacterium]|nr:hypothetical protein [Opitutaceae bacterium]
AIDQAGNVSALRTFVVRLDTTAPVATATTTSPPNSAGWYGAVDVRLTATDEAGGSGVKEIVAVVNGTQSRFTGAAATVPVVAAGVTTVTYYAIDQAGNAGTAKTMTLQRDAIAPTVVATPTTTPNAAGWYNAAVDVRFTANDEAGGSGVKEVVVTANGVTTRSAGATALARVSTDGATTLSYYAIDQAGNVGAAQILTLRRDTTAPAVVANPSAAANAAGWHSAPVDVQFTATDPAGGSGVQEIVVTMNGATTRSAGATAVARVTNAGVTTLTYYAIDRAGNAGATQTITVSRDGTPPTVVAKPSIAPDAAGFYTAAVDVQFTATDEPGGSGVKEVVVTMNGATTRSPGATASARVVNGGVTTLTYYAVDQAGNTSAAQTMTLRRDTTAPTVVAKTSTNSNAAGWFNAAVDVLLTAADEAGGSGVKEVVVTVNGTTTRTAGATATVRIPNDGVTTLTYYAVDQVGNAATPQALSLRLDTRAPGASAAASKPANAAGWSPAGLNVGITAADNAGGSGVKEIVFAVNGVQTRSSGAAVTVPLSKPGTATVTYFAIDLAGNSGPSQTMTLRVDGAAPLVTWTLSKAPNAAGWINSASDVRFAAVDEAGGSGVKEIVTIVNGVEKRVAAATAVLPVSAQGATTVTYFAVDQAGNSGPAQTLTVRLDSLAPTCTEVTRKGPPFSGTMTFRDSVSGIAKLTVVQNVNFNTVMPTFVTGTTSPLGVNATRIDEKKSAVLTVTATDVAGNALTCDPVVTTVTKLKHDQGIQTFTDIPPQESIITVDNDAPGLRAMLVIVNGIEFPVKKMDDDEKRTINVAAAMHPGNNTIVLVPKGKKGESATVTIADH